MVVGELPLEEVGAREKQRCRVEAEASGRLASTCLSPFDVVGHGRICLRTEDTPGRLPVVERIAAGGRRRALRAGEAMGIATGSCAWEPMPSSHSSMLSIMTTRSRSESGSSRARIRPRGGDLTPGQVVSGGARLGPVARRARRRGVADISATTRPRAAVLSTGSELRRPGERLEPGQIYEANGSCWRLSSRQPGRRSSSAARGGRARASGCARAGTRGRRARDLGRRLGGAARPRARGGASSGSRRSSGALPSSRASRSGSACAADARLRPPGQPGLDTCQLRALRAPGAPGASGCGGAAPRFQLGRLAGGVRPTRPRPELVRARRRSRRGEVELEAR